ncbi:AAA family ATPase [Arenibacterium sp. CAU 1754]
MQPQIAGYQVEQQIESYYATSLFHARNAESGRTVLIKTLSASFPDIRDIKRLEREYWVLKDLNGIGGVLPVCEMQFHGNGNPALISEATGQPLTHYLKAKDSLNWPLERVVDLVIQLTETIDAVHDRNMVHKNVAPQNILVDEATWSAKLMNFEIATTLSRERQDRSLSKRLEGSLPYISPEQTGRMSHDLDHRSDFYSLGMVFFQLLFSCLPFKAETQLEWVHSHIGKLPQLPKDAGTGVPKTLVDIVLRLLAKSPEDRYQSSFGLLHDLRECHRQLSRAGRIAPFTLAEKDISEVFRPPQVLYGRDKELAQLSALFENVERGDTEVCLISGYSGVGKSALVDELNKPILRTRGYFLRGKFDQFERAKPYAGISAAFSGLVHELLTETSERLAEWRESMIEVLGENAQVLIDVVPDLEQIIGPQPPVPALPSTEAQNRLQITFVNFVRLLARQDRPLILYLDDLQWSDAPTLNLLQKLATARDIGNLMILGAYRSNEVDSNHLLTLTRNEISKARQVHTVELAPLDELAVNQMVTAALRSDYETTKDLGALLFHKTEGNPFFVNELMKSLVEEGLIRFDRANGHWTWDLTAISRADVGESVVEFLIGNLSKLPEDTKETLRLAACIGHEFGLQKLSVVDPRSKRELGLSLMRALERNIILPLDDGYQLFDEAAANAEALTDPSVNPRFRFQHDRLHQAAYELIDDAEKQHVHLSIGRLLQQEAWDAAPEERVIKIVRHLNEAKDLITEAGEKEELARLNLSAGTIALNASSYQPALHYLMFSRSLLHKDAWERQYDLMKELSSLYAQTAYLTGLHDQADDELSTALIKVRTPLEKAQILSMRTRHYSTRGRMKESIDAALQGLRLLGIDISADIPDAMVNAEIESIARNRAGRNIADLIHADRMTDPNMSAAVGLLMEIFPAAYLSGAGNLFHFLVLKSVNLSLEYGNSTETAFAYAAYGMLLSGSLNQPAEGYAYGKLALAMNESFDDIGLKSRIIYVYTMFIHHWSNHWTTMTEWFKRGIESGYKSGDLLYLAYNAQDCIIWDPTLDLQTAISEQTKYLQIVKDCNYLDSYDSGTLFVQMLLNFAGRTDDQFSLTDTDFDEQACLERMQARKFMTGVANYNIYKAEIHCLYRDFKGALPYVDAQEGLIDSVMSLPQSARFRFIAFLTYAAHLPDAPKNQRPELRDMMARHLAQVSIWSDNCPQNFRHLELAMMGELKRLDDDLMGAFRDYEAAIASAAENGFQRDQAMIHELIAAAFHSAELDTAADAHLSAARYLYYRWGAARKVQQLDAQHSSLEKLALHGGSAQAEVTQSAPGKDPDSITQESLDLASVMDAARAISGEIVLTSLLSRTMRTLLESTGAQRGVFLSRDNGRLQIEVECIAEQSELISREGQGQAKPDMVPLAVINYVLRTKKPLVLNDAAGSSQFGTDPYVASRNTRSIICVPIVRAEQFEGIIYLENDLATGAFPETRVAIVELLAAQAAISIENAKLYVDLEQKVQDRTAELSRKSTALETVANQLSKYLSPQVYQSIFDSQKEVKVTSERKRLTVFFSDLVGFTETADRMASEDLTRLLNQYLSEMSDVALSFGATIDKFVGDAIVIFFGDPETRGVQKDALACAKMAIAMRERLDTLRQEWRDQGIENPLECRMGINTGYCTVGNFGSETRMDYTIIGGAVNLAARLESAADPGKILISNETYAQIKGEVLCTEHGQMTVRGIAHPVQTYEIVDLIENLAHASRPIRATGPHMQLNVDTTHMTAQERRAAAEKLREAAARLEDDLGPEHVDPDRKRLN